VADIRASDQYENGVGFSQVVYTIHRLPDGENDDDWNAHVLDAGDYYMGIDWSEGETEGELVRHYATDIHEDKVVDVVLLDGKGGKLTQDRVDAGDGEFLEFRTHKKAKLGALRLE